MADCLNNEQQINSNLSENNIDALTSNLDGGNLVTSEISENSSIKSSINSINETSSNLGAEEPLNSELDLPITERYTGSEGDNINVTVDKNVIYATLKQIKFNSVADFPEIGSEYLIYIDATNKTLYGWDSKTEAYYQLSSGSNQDIDLEGYVKNETFNDLVNNITQIAGSNGEFKAGGAKGAGTNGIAIGNGAEADNLSIALGKSADTSLSGVAIGNSSSSTGGVAIGVNTETLSGVAIGNNAKTKMEVGGSTVIIDAIQLGQGTNNTNKTLQVYDDNIYNANTHTLTVKNIELDGEDIKDKIGAGGTKIIFREWT